ncbi:hypothetical protein [Francisella sp. 19X1-34]|uniref:hypothetical protein n=1 Tax=Francisella sp. 19X1-34 TaxID=3087177 RepID=UPI002E338DE3|nr:hypothetical protein [Francisella sp. 19X1-34]MED7787987.1 hypothetical protein [Francisella sp. 19X1-34]
MKWRRYKILLKKVIETKANNESIKIIFEKNAIDVNKHKLKRNNVEKEDILLIYGIEYKDRIKNQIIYNISKNKYIDKGIPNILNLLITLFLIMIVIYLHFTNMLLHTVGPFEKIFTISVLIYLHFILFECAKGFIHVKLYLWRNRSKIKNMRNINNKD